MNYVDLACKTKLMDIATEAMNASVRTNEVDLKGFLDYCFKEVTTMIDVGKQVRAERQPINP